jgi:hypothetical protein
MARRKEGRRRNMSIFQDFLTLCWAILIKSLRDAGMASISNRSGLGRATARPAATSARYVRHSGASQA